MSSALRVDDNRPALLTLGKVHRRAVELTELQTLFAEWSLWLEITVGQVRVSNQTEQVVQDMIDEVLAEATGQPRLSSLRKANLPP
jgi:hypothetical protein